MQAFHNDPAIKAKYIARLEAHHKADEIVQGTGWDGQHGCAIGCTLDAYNHEAYPTELGLPVWLAQLEDSIFEHLPAGKAQSFSIEMLRIIPVGADVSKVRLQLALARANRTLVPLRKNKANYARQCVAAIEGVAAYLESAIEGTSTEEQRVKAWSAADAASLSSRSARPAVRSAVWSAARSAADSADSAEFSSWSAMSAAAADSSPWSAYWEFEASTLLQLLAQAPVPTVA